MSAEQTFTCSRCGRPHNMAIFPRIQVAEHPEWKDAVKDGSLFVWECPHCGQRNLAAWQTLYHDPEARLMVWLAPEGSVSEAQADAVNASVAELKDYVLRRVDDVGSLIEKVNIFDQGLDDAVVELCKHVAKLELTENLPDGEAAALLDAPFKFYRMDGADNEITLTYPQDGKMQGVVIGFNVYENCRAILQRNPAMRPTAGFARVDAGWIASRFR